MDHLDNQSIQTMLKTISKGLRMDARYLLQSRKYSLYYNSPNLMYQANRTLIHVNVVHSLVQSNTSPIQIKLNSDNMHKSNRVQKIFQKLIKGGLLDLDSLKVGMKTWKLVISINVITDDGILQHALRAGLIALKNHKLPKLNQKTYQEFPNQYCPIYIPIPFIISFALYQNSVIVDPSLIQQQVKHSKVVVILNRFKEVLLLWKQAQLMNLLQQSSKRLQTWKQKQQNIYNLSQWMNAQQFIIK